MSAAGELPGRATGLPEPGRPASGSLRGSVCRGAGRRLSVENPQLSDPAQDETQRLQGELNFEFRLQVASILGMD